MIIHGKVMKKGFLILLCFLILLFFLWKDRLFEGSALDDSRLRLPPEPTTVQTNQTQQTIQFQGTTYAYQFFIVQSPSTLLLIPNFTQKSTSQTLFSEHSCEKGISGGFYDTSDNPLGGFKSKDLLIKKPVRNRLIDGFLWVKGREAHISVSDPPGDALFYLQTGPLLMVNGGVTSIKIADDEYKRRNVAAQTKDGTLLFFTLYNPESVYEGPLLSDMPSLVQLLGKKLSLPFINAVNLDGGSASAFISPDVTLQEFSPVGSFFCVQ